MRNELKIVLAGFGGQGVLFAGKVIAYAGLLEEREVSWLPSYQVNGDGGRAASDVEQIEAAAQVRQEIGAGGRSRASRVTGQGRRSVTMGVAD